MLTINVLSLFAQVTSKEVIWMKKRIWCALLIVLCIVLVVILADFGGTKPWSWANRLSLEDVDEASIWGDYGSDEHTLSKEETEELVVQLKRLNRLHFQKNKHLQGSTPTCGINLLIDGTEYHLSYYGIFEMRYGDFQWWIRSERFGEYMSSLLDKYNVAI